MFHGHQQSMDMHEEPNHDDIPNEPTSIFISDEWDVINDDFLDDFDDLGDIDFPTLDDDL